MGIPLIFLAFIVFSIGYNFMISSNESKSSDAFDNFFAVNRKYFKKPKSILQSLDYVSLSKEDK